MFVHSLWFAFLMRMRKKELCISLLAGFYACVKGEGRVFLCAFFFLLFSVGGKDYTNKFFI